MERSVSLRRSKIQSKKAKKQALIAIILGIVLLAVFLFVLVPFFFDIAIRMARMNKSTSPTANGDTLPPQRPVLQSLPAATNQTSLEIRGYTEAQAKVTLIIDGSEQGLVTANDDGEFVFSSSLGEGEHQLWVVAEDEAGNQSPLSETHTLAVDVTTPSLTLEQPTSGAVFTLPRERALTVKGKASEKATVYVNSSMVMTDQDGVFQTVIQLGEGKNELTLTAKDAAGNVSEEMKVSVEYQP